MFRLDYTIQVALYDDLCVVYFDGVIVEYETIYNDDIEILNIKALTKIQIYAIIIL